MNFLKALIPRLKLNSWSNKIELVVLIWLMAPLLVPIEILFKSSDKILETIYFPLIYCIKVISNFIAPSSSIDYIHLDNYVISGYVLTIAFFNAFVLLVEFLKTRKFTNTILAWTTLIILVGIMIQVVAIQIL